METLEVPKCQQPVSQGVPKRSICVSKSPVAEAVLGTDGTLSKGSLNECKNARMRESKAFFDHEMGVESSPTHTQC